METQQVRKVNILSYPIVDTILTSRESKVGLSYASNFTFLYQIKNSDVFNTLRSITEKARLDESEINTSKASRRDCRIFSPFSIIE